MLIDLTLGRVLDGLISFVMCLILCHDIIVDQLYSHCILMVFQGILEKASDKPLRRYDTFVFISNQYLT